jgi:GT2 family glycosyltransferase
VGVLETSFESYLEDVDFGLRCALAGYAGLYVPEAVARHRGSASLGRWHPETVRRISRNQVFLVKRHYPRRALVRCAWPILAAQLLWGALAARHGAALAWVRGKWEGVRGHPGACKESQLHDSRALESLLRSNEHEIRNLQAASEFDWYWRVYLLLTRGGAN